MKEGNCRERTGIAMVIYDYDTAASTEQGPGYCPVCGKYGIFLSYEPLNHPCKRNSFYCSICGSVARNRHVAYTILGEFRARADCSNLSEFAGQFDGNIWIGCVKEAVSKSLGPFSNVIRSEYIDGLSSGQTREGILCQDIQATTFDDNLFDLIITEDVLEHVPNPLAAFIEIKRILRPGGKHIFTIPVDWNCSISYARAVMQDDRITHLHPPEFHGDPFRPDGVLAYYTFGHDVIDRFCSLTGPTRLLAANGDRMMERGFQIFNNWVFVSDKVD